LSTGRLTVVVAVLSVTAPSDTVALPEVVIRFGRLLAHVPKADELDFGVALLLELFRTGE
jgi:hypothetical protein